MDTQTMLRIIAEGGGDKPTAQSTATTGKARTSLDDTADVRDILSNLVGRKISGLGDESTRADYARLQALLGPQKAQKLVTQVIIHNQRNANAPMEKSIQDFYDVGSNDAEVNDVLKGIKSFGYGVLPGFRSSSKLGNQILTGQVPGATASVDQDDLQRKVMLRLNK